ncbi:hypothetical protein [Rosenbergiella nectarea]|uniref:EcpB family pilus assembly chaperone n=1 Tax=Rosenbergiella nectarea TaxID=988801 RepID=UPI001F4D8F63|nr:hypothetical protein [Rosenbergiella nectarea]
MKISISIILLVLINITTASALDVGDISSFMNYNNNTLSKEIKNTTENGRLINIRIERLSSPLEGGEVIPMDNKQEILLTPSSILLPANSSDIVRFIYHGPEDAQERYYRIEWMDQALTDLKKNGSTRNAIATASARIGTILVVAPRKVNFNYEFKNNKIVNTGNATLRVIAYGPCIHSAEVNECKENYYLMPGKTREFSKVNVLDKKGKVALWQGENFIPVK